MHAVLVEVEISDAEGSEADLKERVVPRVKSAPGFVRGYWTRNGSRGLSLAVFDTEEQATQMAEVVRSVVPPGVTVDRVEVREVVAEA